MITRAEKTPPTVWVRWVQRFAHQSCMMGTMQATPSATCAFCQIAAGTLPAAIVYETGDLVAFLDTRPLFPGHPLPALAWSELRYSVYCFVMPEAPVKPD